MSKLKSFVVRCYILFLKMLPLKKNRIYFVSNFGERYSCNPKAFYEYLYANHKDEFKFYYCLNKDADNILPKDVKSAKYKSLKDLYYLYTSKFIVNNFRFHKYLFKRKKQIYIQTWHGGPIPQKMIEKDAENLLPESYVKEAKNDSKSMTLLLAGSEKIKKIFSTAFWFDGEVFNCGTPRYDVFFKDNSNLKEKLYDLFKIDKSKKVVLYAPTFRKDGEPEDLVLNNEMLLNAFRNYYKKDVVLLYRFHPNQAKLVKNLKFENENILNVTDYPDSVDLEIFADFLITDFSSTMADFMILRKPCIMLIKDYEEYIMNQRSLYMAIDDMPYPFVKNEGEFNQFLKNNSNFEKNIEDKINKFSISLGLSENGNACESLYNWIKKH